MVPVVVFAYIAIYRPRQVLRLAPVGLVLLVGLVHIASPGALGTLFSNDTGVSSSSTTHRLGDFADVAPDVVARPLLGRGFGTIDPDQPTLFRINDDEYMDEIWQVGDTRPARLPDDDPRPDRDLTAGHPGARSDRVPLALAGSAGCVAYLVANALFDAMSFPQAPYMFFIVAALTTVAAAGPEGNVGSDPGGDPTSAAGGTQRGRRWSSRETPPGPGARRGRAG